MINNTSELRILLGPDYVPEGEYDVKLQDMELSTAKDDGHYYYLANFEVASGEYAGRMIKQVWSFRYGQEKRTSDRINNYLTKLNPDDAISISNSNAGTVFNTIREKLSNEIFKAWLFKNPDSRMVQLFAIKRYF